MENNNVRNTSSGSADEEMSIREHKDQQQNNTGKEQMGQSTQKQQGKTQQQSPGGLTEEDLPESDNQSTGVSGSGQRQDSN